MKKVISTVCLSISMIFATQQMNAQTGTHVTVFPQFVAGVLSGGSTPICSNGTSGLITGTLQTGGQGTYTNQWQKSTDGGTTWTNVLGATSPNFTPVNLLVNTMFRRNDSDPCGTLPTNSISITVHPALTTGIISVAQSICSGTAPSLLVFSTPPSGGDGTFTYQWESSPNGLPAWTIIAGATGNTYQSPSLISGIWYHVIVTSGSGCGSGPAL